MKKHKRKSKEELLIEWKKIRKDHPEFARTIITQQLILMEANSLGSTSIKKRMCELLKYSSAVLFSEYWQKECQPITRIEAIDGWWNCILDNPDPGSCFEGDDDGWFDDPLLDYGQMPPLPPDPHIRPI